MEAKLILKKTSTGFYLWRNPLDKSQELLGATVPIMNNNGVDLREYILSLKNCEAIANGYDLDELVEERFGETFWHDGDKYFKEGFQKALEILGNKNKKNIELLKEKLTDYFEDITDQKSYISEKIDDILQQTEWEVSCNPDVKDADGNLILKRK